MSRFIEINSVQEIEKSIDDELRQKSPSLREEPFGFRVFKTYELEDYARKSDVQRKIGCD